ncbi:hypothetical protein SETIT_3G093400v2 [Setaria italica]|uniref:Uncharacterized protein n=1 Tax=Setaria italica TaxID=4555 RepID=A0A368QD13_SETIT|nr:hypothetical protein SETIT_3G093400v2 [Setaria italica]
MPSALPVAAPAAVRHHQPPRGLHGGERPEPEPSDPGPVRDPARRGRGARVRGGAGRRPVRRRRPGGAPRQDELLQLVRLLHLAGRVRGARLRGVGAEQRGLGPRLRALRARGAPRRHRPPRRPAILPAPEAHGEPTHQNPSAQVFVAAFRKRNLSVPDDLMEMHQATQGTGTSIEVLERTSGFKFLDKAAVDDGDTRRWSLCTVTQVEEAKIILRMLPIFLSSVLGYLPIPLLLTFTVQQGGTMDTRLGAAHVPPASLFVIPVVFQMLILVAYDRAAVPWLRRATGYAGGVTHLQRIGAGFACSVVALSTAAAVEARRRGMGAAAAAEMSVFWLAPQFFLLGVMDVTSFVGLLEFFYGEASAGMKSIGGAVFFCILGVASWLGSLLIRLVNRATARRGGGTGWLDGANLDAGRLDLFYWLLALFGLVSLLLYLLCASRYTYRHDPRTMQSRMEDDRVSPASLKKQAEV